MAARPPVRTSPWRNALVLEQRRRGRSIRAWTLGLVMAAGLATIPPADKLAGGLLAVLPLLAIRFLTVRPEQPPISVSVDGRLSGVDHGRWIAEPGRIRFLGERIDCTLDPHQVELAPNGTLRFEREGKVYEMGGLSEATLRQAREGVFPAGESELLPAPNTGDAPLDWRSALLKYSPLAMLAIGYAIRWARFY